MVSASFDPLLGQTQAVELLSRAVSQDRVAPAYLFAGPSGVGRSLAAKCFLELLLCPSSSTAQLAHASQQDFSTRHPDLTRKRIQQRNHPDLLWVEPTYIHQGKRVSATEATELGIKRKGYPQIRLEQIREITQFLSRPPLEARRSVVVLEQVETMAEAPVNGLLKTLEEPGQATLILIAPGVDSLLPTLVSRCQRVPFYRLNSEVMAEVLQRVGYEEILEHPEVLAIAQGSPGAAIANWQQLQAISPDLLEVIRTQMIELSSSQTGAKPDIIALTLARRIAKELEVETQLWLIDYLQHYYWQQGMGQKAPLQQDAWQSQIGAQQARLLQHLEKARQYLLSYVQPQLVWEVVLLKMIESPYQGIQSH